ncbi:MAG: hypothetical protein LBJ14_11115, partial [Desulfarculales bacterium]|nr:hypothetical protein [Desulfarculales bacterium]
MASNSNNPSFGGFIKIPGGDPYIRQSSPGVMPNFFPALTRPDPAIPQALGQLGQDVVKLGAYFKERKDEKARIDLSSRRLALQENIREMEKHARANMNGRAAI